MTNVAGVRLRYSKTLKFEPNDLALAEGDIVIVSTERGEEIGIVSYPSVEVDEKSVTEKLKSVLRVATEEDLEKAIDLREQEKEAMIPFCDLIAKNKLGIKPIDVEYTFGGEKIVFYFASEQRVDFRALVKDLASHFHTRIDMRQVGVRDQARMIGGFAHCGQELCCARLGGEFAPVSIKMAKEQGLPPNPIKISGGCGRLMCCLRYEVEAYKDANARGPKKGATIKTPKGTATVSKYDALREIVTLAFANKEDNNGKMEFVHVPLGMMICARGEKCGGHSSEGTCGKLDEPQNRSRPCEVPTAAFEELTGKPEEDLVDVPIVEYRRDSRKDAKKDSNTDKLTKSRPAKNEGRNKRRRAKPARTGEGKPKSPAKAREPKTNISPEIDVPILRRRRRRGGSGEVPSDGASVNAPSMPTRVPRRRKK